MVGSENWPDISSLKSKFWDTRFVGTGHLINSWKSHVGPLKTVATVQMQKNSRRLGHLTWPGGLTWDDLGLQFSEKVRKGRLKRYAKKRRRCAPPFFRCSRKTLGGRLNAPPARRGLSDKNEKVFSCLLDKRTGGYYNSTHTQCKLMCNFRLLSFVNLGLCSWYGVDL